ncbi:MAG TPA: hypothetical protein VFP52_05935 [Myxococcales bacterium]|nr:hypothetical protein [Myxococcales bacterium]
MKLNKWITFASAAAMLAGVGACKDNTGGRAGAPGSTSTSSGSTSPEGRRGASLPRSTGMDAGSDVNLRSGGNIGGTTSGSSSSDTSSSPGSTGSTSGSATGSSGSSGSSSGSSSNPR